MINKGTARPRLWIVAGPNGSGKSTAYGRNDLVGFDGSVWIINPDLLTARLQKTEKLPLLDANLAAVQRIGTWLDASIRVHQTIGVETVLSSGKYRRLVELARSHDFEIHLIYVFLDSVEKQLKRIKQRVAKGGHDVPADKVRSRRERSFEQLSCFFYQADRAWVYDNSGAELELVAQKGDGKVRVKADAIPELLKALLPPAMLDDAT
ncbi:AAA family ATPase [Sphingobium yanoikuyae]|uniref:AAA family ATPase n=1 Tax=Sphingobium yanoikuyae TaxID=13690 RepID=UPI0024105E3F|nr:AAA family ATPase [Sphingobium yanoikuyae]MDG2515079.1 AAA family ATPase [Sphingobium yanoikuyae]